MQCYLAGLRSQKVSWCVDEYLTLDAVPGALCVDSLICCNAWPFCAKGAFVRITRII